MTTWVTRRIFAKGRAPPEKLAAYLQVLFTGDGRNDKLPARGGVIDRRTKRTLPTRVKFIVRRGFIKDRYREVKQLAVAIGTVQNLQWA